MAGTIRVGLAVNYAQFERGMVRASKQVQSFAAGMRVLQAGQIISWAQQGIGAVQRFVANMDNAIDTADAFGLSLRAWQRIKISSAMAGIDPEQMAAALQKMTLFLGDVAAGNKKAVETFRALGLAIDDLQGKSTEERFIAIADAIAGMKDNLQQASATADIFGAKQYKLAGAIRASGGGVIRGGGDVGRSAFTAAQERDARDAVAAFKRAAAHLELTTEKIATGFGPVVEQFASGVELFGAFADGLSIIIDGIAWFIRTTIEQVQNGIDAIRNIVATLISGAADLGDIITFGKVDFFKRLMEAEDELIEKNMQAAKNRMDLGDKLDQKLLDKWSRLFGRGQEMEKAAKTIQATPESPTEPEKPKPGQFMSGMSSFISGLIPSRIATDLVASIPVQTQRRDYDAEQLAAQKHTAAGIDRLVSILSQQPEYAQA